MEMIERSWPKRNRAWISLSGTAPTPCGSRRGAPTAGPTNIGSMRRNSTYTSALTRYGNKRGVRKGGLTNTWIGPVNLRSLSHWKRLISIFRRNRGATCINHKNQDCARSFLPSITDRTEEVMSKIMIATAAMLALALAAPAANAKGCIKGAVVGGVAGHYVGSGHGALGA